MIFTRQHLRHLEKDGENFRFVDDGSATAEEKQDLIELDAEMLEIYGHHIITNHKELNK